VIICVYGDDDSDDADVKSYI